MTRTAPRGSFVVRVLGTGGVAFSVLLSAFALLAWTWKEPFGGFLVAAGVAAATGILALRFAGPYGEPSHREALAAVLLAWLAMPSLGALPYLLDGGLGPLDALFESMSGFTTTGATVLTSFDAFGRALFLWRAFTQWLGGIGILVAFLAIFPQLAIAGRQLFAAEAPGPSEDRFTPHLRSTALAVLWVYLGLSVAAAIAYGVAGMSAYDAVAHAMTTMAAGGFSPEARSFEGFSPAAQWVAIVFMTFAGANFALQFRAFTGRPSTLLRDPEFRAYLVIALGGGGLLALLLAPTFGADALRHGLFQSLSILTTTGYASIDFANWGPAADAVLLVLMFIGGSAGSAAGGVKVVRWLIVIRNTGREVRRTLHPRAVLPVRLGERAVPEDVLRAVAAFLTLYVAVFAGVAASLALLGHDFVTAFTASIATLGNIGPGLAVVGPMASFAEFGVAAKILLVFAMYAGRLEVVTVFVVFTRDWWKVPRTWRSPLRPPQPSRRT